MECLDLVTFQTEGTVRGVFGIGQKFYIETERKRDTSISLINNRIVTMSLKNGTSGVGSKVWG